MRRIVMVAIESDDIGYKCSKDCPFWHSGTSTRSHCGLADDTLIDMKRHPSCLGHEYYGSEFPRALVPRKRDS